MHSDSAIFWFRRDLRLADNPALLQALSHKRVMLLYIHFEDVDQPDSLLGAASKVWLRESLKELDKALASRLILLNGDPEQLIPSLAHRFDVSNVYWNRCYEPQSIQRDKAIKQSLVDQNVSVQSFNGSLLWEPWTVLKKDGTPYRVFTPYFKKGCLAGASTIAPRQPLKSPALEKIKDRCIDPAKISIEERINADLLLPSSGLDWEKETLSHWKVGEDAANEQLTEFISERLTSYKSGRDRPAQFSTSNLSPYLHFGELSPNSAWYAINQLFDIDDHPDVYTFLSELGWREFSYYLLYHWPDLPHREFNSRLSGIPWQGTQSQLRAWQRGMTGIPIVDAGMRELWQTGFMHNRVRMIVASMLVKNLLVDWREGAQWFMDCLFDADLAANSQNWQWVAGTGADAAPYFRIFNPVLQGEKFDTEGDYVKRFCPELKAMPKKFIHRPWEASQQILRAANVELGVDYPEPIVDLKATRERALAVYKEVAGAAKAALK